MCLLAVGQPVPVSEPELGSVEGAAAALSVTASDDCIVARASRHVDELLVADKAAAAEPVGATASEYAEAWEACEQVFVAKLFVGVAAFVAVAEAELEGGHPWARHNYFVLSEVHDWRHRSTHFLAH